METGNGGEGEEHRTANIERRTAEVVRALSPEAVGLLRRWVQIPSVNHPPHGDERAIQEFYHAYLLDHGLESCLINPSDVPAFSGHPARLPEHDMTGRPNVKATVKGTGGGRSLLVLAHADTMPVGDPAAWTDDPFSGALRHGRVYGRGAGDDKSGMAVAAMLPQALRQAGIRLRGDLTIASVADEEYGGGNGTAALLASGVNADAAVYLDGTRDLAIWNAGLGCGTVEITISGDSAQALDAAEEVLRGFILEQKETIKQAILTHPSFGIDFFTDLMAGHFFHLRSRRPDPRRVTLSCILDTLPGDNEERLKRHFENNLRARVGGRTGIEITWMSRFLKPAELPADHPLVTELAGAFEQATHRKARVSAGCQSDQGLVIKYGGIPCVLFGCGRRGKEGAPHQPNEYVQVDEFLETLLTMVLFAADWCGTDPG